MSCDNLTPLEAAFVGLDCLSRSRFRCLRCVVARPRRRLGWLPRPARRSWYVAELLGLPRVVWQSSR